MTRIFRIAAITVALLACLAVASYITTGHYFDGGFPAGAIRMKVVDPTGKPVKGAFLRVYEGGTSDPAFKYPLDNYLTDRDLASDDEGRITAVRQSGRLQFGGFAWRLFWIIPMGAQAPQYDCEITAAGFKPARFSVWRLFESPHRYYADFPKAKVKIGRNELELPLYEHSFTLKD
jgi:hypothetical protein